MIITTKTRLAISVAALFLAQGAFACDYPERIKDIPDGNSATRDQMIAGKKSVQSYIANMESYLSCIDEEEKNAVKAMGDIDEDTKKQRSETFNKKYNAAVEEMNLVAEEFNIQVRAYKARGN
jgi:hypothetical protein